MEAKLWESNDWFVGGKYWGYVTKLRRYGNQMIGLWEPNDGVIETK